MIPRPFIPLDPVLYKAIISLLATLCHRVRDGNLTLVNIAVLYLTYCQGGGRGEKGKVDSSFTCVINCSYLFFYVGSGGNNHAVDYYKETSYPLAVKLGTITPDGAGNH